MKIAVAKRYVSAMAVAALVLGAGAVYTVTTVSQEGRTAYAYTSAANTQDPATAQDDYVVTIPDANLRKALNKVIAAAMGTSRTDAQVITAGEMRTVTGATADFNETGAQNFLSRSGIKNLEGIQFLTNAEAINLGVNLLSDENALRPLSSLTQLKRLNLFHAFRTGDPAFTPPVNILAPIKDLPALEALHLNTNKLTPEHLTVLKDAPKLKTLLIAGNNVLQLNDLLKDGFRALDQTSTFSSQKHDITLAKDQAVFANPVRDYNGAVVPITETATVKNVDAAGQPNQAGGYIKLIDTYGKNKADIRWATPPVDSARFGAQTFSGIITVNYDLSPRDTEAPTFSPEQPAKIVSRKGVALNLSDVTAQDNQGGSGIAPGGVTHNAAAINLDPNNPAKGNYELTYSVQDNAGNTATVRRSIEITDADALQARVATVTSDFLRGYTRDTQDTVREKKTAAEAVIAKTDATQAEIDEALRQLNEAIAGLRADKRPIESAVTNKYNAEPDHIKNDPAVTAAVNEANRVYNLPNPTKEEVRKAADDVLRAIETAKQQESDRRTAAIDALNAVEGDDKKPDRTPSAIQEAKDKINAIRDTGLRDSMLQELKSIEDEYASKKDELRQLITRAKDPATRAGSDQESINHLEADIRNAEAVLTAGDNSSQAVVEILTRSLQLGIDSLRPDKTALQAVINSVSSESAFVKNDAQVRAKLQTASDVNNNPNANADQIKQAKDELEKAIADARAAELEQQRQAAATNAIAEAKKPGNQSPVYFKAAQKRIDAVQDQVRKAELQKELDALKAAHTKAHDDLRASLEKAQDPILAEGVTQNTKDALRRAIENAKASVSQDDLDQSVYELLTKELQDAIANLRADKQPLMDAEEAYDDQPDYIKNNPAVAAAFRKAQNTRAMANPPVKQVRDDAKALHDAIAAAAQAENAAQQSAANALQQAADGLNGQLAPDEMPAIDVAALETQVAAVQDPVRKAALQAELDALKAKIAARQKQVDDYKQSEEGKRAEAERKAREEAERQAREAAERSARTQAEQLADTGAPLVAPVAGGLGAMLAGAWALIRRKRQ